MEKEEGTSNTNSSGTDTTNTDTTSTTSTSKDKDKDSGEENVQQQQDDVSSGKDKIPTTTKASNNNKKITLYIYEGVKDWGVECFDPLCLSLLTFLRFCDKSHSTENIEIVKCNNPNMSTNGLPFIMHGPDREVLTGTLLIMNYLMDNGFPLKHRLMPAEKAETIAFTLLVEEKLNDILLYNWWDLPENYKEVIKLPHYNVNCFPLNLILPKIKGQNVATRLSNFHGWDKYQIHERVDNIYKALSDRLGDSTYFFGSDPTPLDAIVFGHLIIHIKATFPSSSMLLVHLKKYPNLHKFCANIYQTYWGEELDTEGCFDVITEDMDRKEREEVNQARFISHKGLYFVAIGFCAIGGIYLLKYFQKP